MKKTQFIEMKRSIQKTILTFLSIAIIVALGVAVYLGVHFAAQGLEDTNSNQYRKERFQDFQATSIYGFTQADVDAVKGLKQVETAAGVRSINVIITGEEIKGEGEVIAISKGVNQGDIRQGRRPKEKNECVVDERWAKKNGLEIGDHITIQTKKASRQEELTVQKLSVTGFVSCVGSNQKSATILVPQITFSQHAFAGTYESMVIRIQGSNTLPIYGEEYQQLAAGSRKILQNFLDERADLRYQEIHKKAEENLAGKENQLKEAEKMLETAKIQLEEKEKQLQEGEKEYEAGRKELGEAQIQIADGERQLQEGAKALEKAGAELADAEAALNNGRTQLVEGREVLDNGWKQLEDSEYELDMQKQTIQSTIVHDMVILLNLPSDDSDTETKQVMAELEFYITNNEQITEYNAVEYVLNRHQITDDFIRDGVHQSAEQGKLEEILVTWKAALTGMNEAKKLLEQEEALYTQKLNEYNDSLVKYNVRLGEYESGITQYEDGQKKLGIARLEYEKGKEKLAAGEKLLIEGREALSNGKKQYDENSKKYQDSEKDIRKAEKKVSQITPVSCILLGRKEEASYITIGINAQNLKKLGLSFAVSFMCVAVMACYAAIGRMVEEQRKLIGIQKAQGFFAGEISTRYMCYGLGSTLLGIITGTAAAYYLVQPILLSAYRSLGNFEKMHAAFLPRLTILISVLVLSMAAGSVWLASRRILKEQAYLLMKDPIPNGKSNIFSRLGVWSRLPLFTRILVGNLFSEKKRVITCMIGVAGCTVLVVMGASLKISSDAAPEIQYKQIYQYDKKVTIKKNGDYEALNKQLSLLGCESTPIISKTIMFKVNGGLNFSTAIMPEAENFAVFMNLKRAYSKEALQVPTEGVLMSQGTAKAYNIKAGDKITGVNERGETYDLKVQGIFENYVGQRLVMSPEYYKQICGQEERVNQYYVKLHGTTETEFQNAMDTVPDVTKVADADEDRGDFDNVSGTLNQILMILVILSIAMAFMILTNLTAMNIRHKEKELAIMRVNGFTLGETRAYMMREAVVITLLGIGLGIVLGQLLGEQSRIMMQNRGMQLMGGAKPLAWAAGALISGTFSLLIHLFAMRVINKIKLTNIS